VSEAGQASPQGFEAIPARPPSAPSRVPHFIWAGIALLCLVLFGTALGLFLWSRDRFSSKDLKTATSLTVGYTLKNGVGKSITVSDPAEVRALLDALDITGTRPGAMSGPNAAGGQPGWVDFVLPDATVVRCHFFFNPNTLVRDNWGQVYVMPSFYQKVCDVASRAEGRRIDVMSPNN